MKLSTILLTVRAGIMRIHEFLKDDPWSEANPYCGTFPYEGYPSWEEYIAMFEGYCGMGAPGDRDKYYYRLPVWAAGNVYFNGARPMSSETDALVDTEHEIRIGMKEQDGAWNLDSNIYEVLNETGIKNLACGIISTQTLGMAFEPEEKFENPDGTPIVFQYDYFGTRRPVHPLPGPLAFPEEAGTSLDG